MDFKTSSTSAWGNARMRVAMVLDVTGSMKDNGKMAAMQKAAKALVDQLAKLVKTDGDVYISMVPFAKDVNLGTSYKDATWIDWGFWSDQNPTWGTCSNTSKTNKTDCLSKSGRTWTPDKTKWTGCVTDRTQNYDITNAEPTSTNAPTMVVPEEYGSYCKSSSSAYMPPIVPLTYNWTTLTDAIGKLQPTGNTNQGIGLAWGWLTLGVGKAPFNAPAKDTDNYDYTDAIVLLSDGLNTQNRWTSDPAKIDDREEKMCAAAKAAPNNITIYAVQVDTGGDTDLSGAERLRQQRGQVLPDHRPRQDRVGVQFDRTVAVQAARLAVTVEQPARSNSGKNIKKKPGRNGRAFLLSKYQIANELVRGRGKLRDQALVGLEGLLGEIGVEAGDLLRFRDEGLVGRAREFGLRFDRLVQRLHAGELFNVRFGVLERLLGVVAIGGRDRLNAALQVARGSGNRFEMLFAVVLNVFNLDHQWSPFPDCRCKPIAGRSRPPDLHLYMCNAQ